MKDWLFPVLLQTVGFMVVVAEVFIPSMGMLSAVALGLLGYSLYLAYTTISVHAFYVILGLDVVVMPLILILGLRVLAVSPLALKKKLSAGDGVVSQAPELETHLNRTGRTLTALRPSGTAVIDDIRLDVVSDGDFIDAGTPVRVTAVTGNQIIVAKRE